MALKSKYELKIEGTVQAIREVEELGDKLERIEQELGEAEEGTLAFERLTKELELTNIQSERAVKNLNTLNSQKMSGLRGTLSSIGNGFTSIASQATGASGGIDLLTKTTQALGIESDLLNSIIEKFGGVASSSFETAGKGATRFGTVTKVALASTGIGLLLVAVASLTAYFTKSAEGSEKLAMKLAYLKGVFTGIVNVLSDIGKGIADAFSDPEGTIDTMTDKVTNFFSALGQAATGNGAKLGIMLNDLWNGVKKVGDEIDKVGEKSVAIEKLTRAYQKTGIEISKQVAQLQGVVQMNEAVAQSDLRTQKERTDAANTAYRAKQQILTLQKQELQNNLNLLQLQNSQVAGGKKTSDMLKAEQDIRNEIQAKSNEAQLLELEREERIYTTKKEAADRIKDSLEAEYERKKLSNEVSLAEATTQEEKLRLHKATLDAQIEYNTKATAAYMTLEDTSDRAAALLSLTTEMNDAEREYTANVKATNEEYAKRQNDAQVKTSVGELENYKLKAVQAGLDKQYDLQLFYINKAKGQELKVLNDAYKKEISVKGLSNDELEAIHLDYINKKLALDQNYAAQVKTVEDGIKERKKADAEKEIADLQAKYETMNAVYEGFAQNVQAISDAFTNASLEAFDAKLAEVDIMIQSYREQMSALESEIQESESRVNDLEASLLTAKGAEREKIIQQLEQERKKQRQLAQERKAEDQRIKKAEQEKIRLEQEKEKSLAKQEILVQALTMVQHGLNAAKAIEAALDASKNGKFGWDNIAILAAATAGIIVSMAAIKSAAKKGFYDGGFTSKSISDGTEVGVVHANEYVLPAWMVRQNPVLVSQLESVRTQGKYSTGGMVAQNITQPSQTDLALVNQIQLLRNDIQTYSQTPIHVVATEVADVNARVADIKEYSVK
ncbi:hypothetical protein EFA69_06605 [Rufibacter immobilis]|uniref:Uncharacterized protein n=1 Tax=Rufibacter immobilis TaxID=1348778 RepID=A0A3M9N0N3_9BACT|nr:hypothetical protein [Rufibacter immobilis]RNI30957.1 hypothetical protein EFA69_06605 [Rufibacter immobilis]